MRLVEELTAWCGGPPGRVTCAFAPGHGVVWTVFTPALLDRDAEVCAIRLAVEEGAMSQVWTRTGV